MMNEQYEQYDHANDYSTIATYETYNDGGHNDCSNTALFNGEAVSVPRQPTRVVTWDDKAMKPPPPPPPSSQKERLVTYHYFSPNSAPANGSVAANSGQYHQYHQQQQNNQSDYSRDGAEPTIGTYSTGMPLNSMGPGSVVVPNASGQQQYSVNGNSYVLQQQHGATYNPNYNPTMASTIATYDAPPMQYYHHQGSQSIITAPPPPPPLLPHQATMNSNVNNMTYHGGHVRGVPNIQHPPVRTPKKAQQLRSGISSKLASPITNKPNKKVRPGRLFVRVPMTCNELMFELGEFKVGIQMTEIESFIVERVRKKLEKKTQKATKRENKKGGVYGMRSSGSIGTMVESRDDVSSVGSMQQLRQQQQQQGQQQQEVQKEQQLTVEVPKLASLQITHTTSSSQTSTNSPPPTTKEIWSSTPGLNFIGAASLSCLDIASSGTMTEQYLRMYSIQTVDSIQRGPAKHVVTMTGQLGHAVVNGELPPNSPVYSLTFELLPQQPRALKFTLRVEGGEAGKLENGRQYNFVANSVQMFVRSEVTEAFYGLGGRFGATNLKGSEIQVCHPTSNTSGNGGGRLYSTKSTVNALTLPHFVNSYGTSLHLHNVEPTTFDFGNELYYSIRTPCSLLSGTFLSADSLLHACELHTSLVGRTRPLPKWTQRNGVLMGIQGGTMGVQLTCKVLFKYKCEVAGVLIRDWTGVKANTAGSNSISGNSSSGGGASIGAGGASGSGSGTMTASTNRSAGGNTSWYNWVLEREHYPQWQPFVDSLERRGISVGLYLCPYLEEIPMHLRSGRRYLFGEVGDDYFVKERRAVTSSAGNNNTASSGSSSKSTRSKVGNKDGNKQDNSKDAQNIKMYNHFKRSKCGMLDPTNYSATSWFKQVVKDEVLTYSSASFWLADTSMGGPPFDVMYSASAPNLQVANTTSAGGSRGGGGGLAFHNSYAEQWSKMNRDAIKEAGRDGDAFFIVNSAYGSSAKDVGCTSLGDYVANFHHDNGGILRAILNGLINGGFSGLTHGHCAVNMAVPRRVSNAIGTAIDSKSREMICRWFEMTAFTTMFRTHDGDANVGDGNAGGSTGKHYGSNHMLSAYDDEVVVKQLARWSHVYVALSEYRLQLLNEASFRGYPVVRHPMLHFPTDENFTRENKSNSSSNSASSSGLSPSSSGSSAFMMGDLIYVVPILKSGVVKRGVYLPEGGWIHLWSGDQVAGPHNIGKTIEVMAPVGEPPVFIRDCPLMHRFVEVLKEKRVIVVDSKRRRRRGSAKSSLFSSFRRRK